VWHWQVQDRDTLFARPRAQTAVICSSSVRRLAGTDFDGHPKATNRHSDPGRQGDKSDNWAERIG
jgi:hypothetical protein